MNRDLTLADKKQRILNTFKYYTQGPSVPSDGNCGLHAICKALGEGLSMTGSNIKPTSLMRNIFHMFDLKNLPYYWWSDEELAVIANDFGYDLYIYNETDRTGIVYGKGIRSPLVLYSVNDNSHWIPGMKTVVPSSCIPENFTIIENISEVLSIRQIKIKIKGHLLMRSLNPSGGCIETYSVRHDGSRSSSNGRRVVRSSRRHYRSRSGGRDEGRDGSHVGRNNVSHNTKRDESRSLGRNGKRSSGGRDGVRIVRQDGDRPQSEKVHGRGVKGSHSAVEKESQSGGKKGSHIDGETGGNGVREKGSHSGREKSHSKKSDEKLLVQYSPPVNDDCSYDVNAAKKKFSLYAKLKNTVLNKIIRQLYPWNRNKKNKYQKLDLLESEDEVHDLENTELNDMYNARYTVMRDMLHHFVSKDEHKLLMLEASDALVAPQSLGPTIFQLEPIKCLQLKPIEVEYPMVDINCCQIAAVQYCPIATVHCCSIGVIDCCSNVVVDCCPTVGCLYKTFECPCMSTECPFISTNCPCNIDDCPFTAPEYPFSDQWVSDKYINDLFYGYTLGQNKIKGVRLFDRVYKQAIAMSNNVIVRCIVKPKRAVEAPPTVSSVLVTPAVMTSVVTASVFASPAMAAWVVEAPGLASSVMQVAHKVTAPAMVALMMVAPEMVEMTVLVAPLGKDLVTVPVDSDLPATSVENNLSVASVDNDSVVKLNKCVKRNFSLKQIWKKKTKTQLSKEH